MQKHPKSRQCMFALYPEDDAVINAYAEARCRGNRSEALRRMIEFAADNLLPAQGVIIPEGSFSVPPQA